MHGTEEKSGGCSGQDTNTSARIDSVNGDHAEENNMKLSFRAKLAVASVVYAYVCALGGALTILPIIAVINEDLGPDTSYSWMASAFSVAAAVGMHPS